MELIKVRSYFFIFLLALPLIASAQLFRPLGLGFNGGERQGDLSQPRMHIEGDKLYVCTSQGLYVKDLTDDNSVWQRVGFNGIPLQDYTRSGADILALRYNEGGEYLLLSHNGGKTYEDVTPDIFRNGVHERLGCLVQHPTDPNTVLVASNYKGVCRSFNFGQTWNDHGNSLGFPGDNCVHQVAFHPTCPDQWVAGGEGCVFLTENNGLTWSCQNYWGDEARTAYWFFAAFDKEHPDTIYMVGCLGRNEQKNACIKIMCSTNGGHSWYESQMLESARESDRVNDLQQYNNYLIIYAESDVYIVSKAELIAQSTASINTLILDDANAPAYDLQGRRIKEPKHGIYIKNGKKYSNK